MSRSFWATGRATTIFTERPTILGMPAALREALQVGLLRRLRPVLGRYRLARISGALCEPRRTIAEFAPTSRRLVSCLFAAQARRVPRLSRVRAILLSPVRWQGARLTSH